MENKYRKELIDILIKDCRYNEGWLNASTTRSLVAMLPVSSLKNFLRKHGLDKTTTHEELHKHIQRGTIERKKKKRGLLDSIWDIQNDSLTIKKDEKIYDYDDYGFAVVKQNDLYGIIDKDGGEIVPCIYEEIYDYDDNGFAVVKQNGLYGRIDRYGKEKDPVIYKKIGYSNIRGSNFSENEIPENRKYINDYGRKVVLEKYGKGQLKHHIYEACNFAITKISVKEALEEYEAKLLLKTEKIKDNSSQKNAKITEEEYEGDEQKVLKYKTALDNIDKVYNTNITNDEELFIKEIKICLEDDNIIDELEEIYLKRFRVRFNISEDRARELRSIVLSDIPLSKDEKEYLEDYKMFIKQSEIQERERMMLNRLAKFLGISEERARVLEQNYL